MRRIFFDLLRLSYPRNRVTTFQWRPTPFKTNFGDALAPVVVAKILTRRGLLPDSPAKKTTVLYPVGSSLSLTMTGDTIWGAGINGKPAMKRFRSGNLDVRAVRGPLTRSFLLERGIDCPEIYGDPGLLLPLLLPNRVSAAPTETILCPHWLDIEHFPHVPARLSPLMPWPRYLERLLTAKFVVGSSLHSLIVAEAYGIPARYVRLSETEDLFKYTDYMSGTGRDKFEYARSIDEAIEMGGMEPPKFDPQPLLDAFPFDLWLGQPK